MYSNNIRIILPTEYVFEYIPSNTIRITIPNTATTNLDTLNEKSPTLFYKIINH